MQFLTSVFGGSENSIVTAILALGIVLALIVLGLWALKVFFKASTNLGRGANRRLSVVDSVVVDPRRKLLIIRRDNVEHLILTGGPQDVVVETGIPVERKPQAPRHTTFASKRPPVEGAAARGEHGTEPSANAPLLRQSAERLRASPRPSSQHPPTSLRHTGLMRPVSRSDTAVIPMNPERSDHQPVDSATTEPSNESSGQARLGAGTYIRDISFKEGN